MVVTIPYNLSVEKIEPVSFKKNWDSIENYVYCQKMRSKWLNDLTSCILQIRSAVVKKENNYLINLRHPNFAKKIAERKRRVLFREAILINASSVYF